MAAAIDTPDSCRPVRRPVAPDAPLAAPIVPSLSPFPRAFPQRLGAEAQRPVQQRQRLLFAPRVVLQPEREYPEIKYPKPVCPQIAHPRNLPGLLRLRQHVPDETQIAQPQLLRVDAQRAQRRLRLQRPANRRPNETFVRLQLLQMPVHDGEKLLRQRRLFQPPLAAKPLNQLLGFPLKKIER